GRRDSRVEEKMAKELRGLYKDVTEGGMSFEMIARSSSSVMLMNDGRINVDLHNSIFRQFDPTYRADRYALYNCLLVSRLYFELAAPILWSSQTFSVDLNDSDRRQCRFLLEHVVANNPPTPDTANGSPPSARDQRLHIYLRTIRLHSVEAMWVDDGANLDWADALATHLGVPGRRPPHLTLCAAAADTGVKCLIGPRLRSFGAIAFEEDGDGKMASLLGWLPADLDLYAIRFKWSHGGLDWAAMANCLIAHGPTLRSLGILDDSEPTRFSDDIITRVLASVNQLTQIRLQGLRHEPQILFAGLLRSCSTTLVDVQLWGVNVRLLPVASLSKLESLTLKNYIHIGHQGEDLAHLQLDSMAFLCSLTLEVEFQHAHHLAALMNTINGVEALQELSLTLTMNFLPVVENNVEVQLVIGDLRKLHLDWEATMQPTAWLSVINYGDIEMNGLPRLEEIELTFINFDMKCAGISCDFVRVLHNAVVDDSKTPALAYARVSLQFTLKGAFGAQLADVDYFYELWGGRSRFSWGSYNFMREQYRQVRSRFPALQDVK
ncbi:hypothetical protein HK101_005271, partial [Irineochytrium annulatum]